MASKLQIIYEDNHLLAMSKPAGLATMGLIAGKPTLLTLAKEYIKRQYNKPGNVYLGVMSRLDAPVTGVVLFARTSKAAARLTEQFRSHAVEKTYWALVAGILNPPADSYEDYLGKDEGHHRMCIVGSASPGAKLAKLSYRRLKIIENNSLLEIMPKTGRKHQIRVQFAYHGYPILGDRKYGGRQSFPSGIALHARRLAIRHPIKGDLITFEAHLPEVWLRWGVDEFA